MKLNIQSTQMSKQKNDKNNIDKDKKKAEVNLSKLVNSQLKLWERDSPIKNKWKK